MPPPLTIDDISAFLDMSSTDNDLVSGEELARWLGLGGKEIYDLGKAGVLVRVGRLYRLEESVRRYCEYLRRTAATKVAAANAPTILADAGEIPR